MAKIQLIAVIILLLFSALAAQLQVVGRAMPGEAQAAFTVGSTCYVCAGNQVQIFNVTDPADPQLTASETIPGTAEDIYVEGDYAYVAIEDSGFCILNITDINNLFIVSVTGVNTNVYGIFYNDFQVYLATADSGMIIYDVSDPQIPGRLGKCDSFHTSWVTQSVYVQGNYAYVAASYDGFSIIDISNPTDPQVVYNYDVQDFWAYDVKVSGCWVYLSFSTYDSGSGLLTFQVPVNPAETKQIEEANTNYSARRLDIGGGYAYLACRIGGLNIIDISNPTLPVLENIWLHGESNNLFYKDNYVYLADTYDGLYILDVNNVSNIIERGNYDTHTLSRDIAIVGNYLYMTERDPACLKIFDISEKRTPLLVYDQNIFEEDGGVASEITADSDYLYISCYANFDGGDHQFRWYKLTDPANPQFIGKFDETVMGIRSHDIQGNKAYIGNSSNLRVLDLSVEQDPIPMLGYYSNDYDGIRSVEVQGSYAYLATEASGFRIVNIEHPGFMFEAGKLATSSETFDVAVQGNYAYLAEWDAGFRIVDISDPAHPAAIDSVQIPGEGVVRIAVKNDTAYVSWNNEGIRLYDVSDPHQITETEYYETGDPEHIRFDDKYIYVADDGGGLYIFKNENLTGIKDLTVNELPRDFCLDQNYPNPFNPSTSIEFYLPKSATVSLKIYNIAGQLVKTLLEGNIMAGDHSVNWDGTNNKGAKTASGVYLYKLNYAGHSWFKKMTLIR